MKNKANEIISIGFLIDKKEDNFFKEIMKNVTEHLEKDFSKNFSEFNWQLRIIERKDFIRDAPIDPLELLDYGSSLKFEYNLDFLIICTSLPLKPRFSQFVNAVPSNMLEIAVVSIARLLENEEIGNDDNMLIKALLSLIKHNLGHLWGLEHNESSVMKPLNIWGENSYHTWSDEEKEHIKDYLKKIADPRIEETFSVPKNKFIFYMQFIKKEGVPIIRDIILSRSWLTILHLSKFIATIVMSSIFLFLTAEFWEMGAAFRTNWLYTLIIFVLIAVTFSLYFGQNLHKVAFYDKLKEQSVRSKIVIIGTLFIGIAALWIFLFFISVLIIYLFPEKVLTGWAGITGKLPVFHFALIISIFGILMSAFGGNLEEEDDLKAILFYTEET